MRNVVAILMLGLVACTTVTTGWVEVAPMAVARSEHPGVMLDGEVVILGGFTEVGLGRSGVTSGVEAYSPDDDAWHELPDLPEPRHHGMAAVVEDRLFMIGGYSESGEPSITVWELADAQWVERAPLPGPMAAAASAVVDDSIYVVGGVPDSILYRYDPGADSWTVLPPPEQQREHVAVVALDGQVWAIAGRWTGGILDSTEVFDPETGTWRPGPALNEARSGFGAAVVGGQILAVGGEVFSPDTALDSVELYDPGSGLWSQLDPLPQGLHGHPLVAIGTDVYLPGGSTRAAGIENDGRTYRLSFG